MKDWLATLALAGASLAAFFAFFIGARGNSSAEPEVSRPLSTEAGPNGYLGMVRWLRDQQVEPLLLRERFTSLSKTPDYPARGNLLITTAPYLYPLRNSEFGPLQRWIEAGNTLLLVAALSDQPEWAGDRFRFPATLASLERMTGLSFSPMAYVGSAVRAAASEADAAPASESDSDLDPTGTAGEESLDESAAVVPDPELQMSGKLKQPLQLEMIPLGAHQLLAGVERVRAISEYAPSTWTALPDKTPLVLELASTARERAAVLWLARMGRGQIIISGFGSAFTNKLLARADNARLLANIVRWSLAAEGRVIIDDAHQGSVAFHDPAAFFSDSRLHLTLWCVFGLWLVFVLGPQRLRSTAGRWNPTDLTTFVRATGGFMARVVEPHAAAQRMFESFFAEIHRRTGLTQGQTPPWDWLETHTGSGAADLALMRQLHGRALGKRRVDLRQLHAVLTRVRGSWLQH